MPTKMATSEYSRSVFSNNIPLRKLCKIPNTRYKTAMISKEKFQMLNGKNDKIIDNSIKISVVITE
jgi:hypothetical protein